ncbi:MAG: nitroreductase family protein [bacterium]
MDLTEVIKSRRAYRSLEKTVVTEDLIRTLASAASLSASCFNHQPWKFVFVYENNILEELKTALSKGNDWARNSSMIIAVLSKQNDDCILDYRKYYLFDTGMATALLILKATELGYVAHPIAGYNPETAKSVIKSPDDMEIITLIIFGKHKEEIDSILSEKQRNDEIKRPERKAFNEYACFNRYCL